MPPCHLPLCRVSLYSFVLLSEGVFIQSYFSPLPLPTRRHNHKGDEILVLSGVVVPQMQDPALGLVVTPLIARVDSADLAG